MRNRPFWIMGAGRFGRLAWERLLNKQPGADISVVDRLGGPVPSGIEMVTADAVDFLRDNLDARTGAWIIPAVPVHLAYEWLAGKLVRECRFNPLDVPPGLMSQLPNLCRGHDGQVYISNADFRCPDDCLEPGATCPHTRKPRPRVLHTFLADLTIEKFSPVVIRSLQLAPGVGGFRAATLWTLYQEMRSRKGHFLFSTACKCHAVMNAFALARKR